MSSPDSTSSPHKKIAVLRDRLFVSGEFVTEEMLDAYKSEMVIGYAPKIDPYTMMPEVDNYGKQIQEPIIETVNHYQISYLSADNIIYSFNRGDMQKLRRTFHDFEIVDERISIPIKARLKIRFPEGMGWRDYQPDAIDALINNDSGILKAPPRSGKPVWVENLVTMGDGSYRKLKDVKVGDFVITDKGRARKVLEVFEQPEQLCLRLVTRSGIETITALDHPYLTPEGFVQAKDLRPGMHLTHVCFDLPPSPRKDEEFLLAGFFVGDGTTLYNQATISTKDEKRIAEILRCCKVLGFKTSVYTPGERVPKINISEGVLPWLREGELADKGAWDKHVPSWVFQGSNRQISLFLSAYFACDGTVSSRGKAKNGENRSDTSIEMYSVSKVLLQGCQKLLGRLGVRTAIRTKKGKYKKADHSSWRLAFHEQDDVVKFRDLAYDCGTKTEKLKSIKGFRTDHSRIQWTDELLSAEVMRNKLDCRCLTVDEDHTFISDDLVVHNTLMITATICLERQKTIVFAHQTDLLVQLYDTFMKFTNLPDLQTPGDPIVGFAKDISDFDKLDVVLCTKQTFDHINNKPMLAVIQKMFGSVFVDEVHFLAAEMYSKTLNRFWAKTRRGVTATPKRKDGFDVVTQEIIGPTIHTITPEQVKQVPMEVERINTNVKLKVRNFTKILGLLAENERRNELIVGHMVQDVSLGHTIIAVTDRKQHQMELKKLLKQHGIECELFNGELGANREKRKQILNRLREREVPVLIAMRNMTTGLDIPRADMFYNLLPSANAVKDGEDMGEGGYEQQCTRVRTEFPGKTVCKVKDFVDSFGIAYACWNERRKTYNKIGAVIQRAKEDEPIQFEMFHMDDGLGGAGGMQ